MRIITIMGRLIVIESHTVQYHLTFLVHWIQASSKFRGFFLRMGDHLEWGVAGLFSLFNGEWMTIELPTDTNWAVKRKRGVGERDHSLSIQIITPRACARSKAICLYVCCHRRHENLGSYSTRRQKQINHNWRKTGLSMLQTVQHMSRTSQIVHFCPCLSTT